MSQKGVLRIKVIGQDAGLGKTFDSTGDKAVAWGKKILGVAVAFAALDKIEDVLAGNVRAFGNFDDAMTQSLAIMGNIDDRMRSRMEAAAKDVSRATTFSSTEAAKAYYYLASAGFNAQQSIGALPQVAKFAQAGMFDMALATDLATDAQSALGLRSANTEQNLENLTRVTDVLVKANILANASVEQFAISLTTKAGAAMKSVGMEIEEGVGVLAAFADQGVKAEEGGTQFAIVLRDLQTKALENKKVFKDYGVEVFNSSGELNNMADIVGDLERALEGMSDEQKKSTLIQLGFTDKSIGSLLALMGTSEAIRTYEKGLREAGGLTEEVAKKQLESFNSQMKLARNRIEEAGIVAGSQLAPAIKDTAEWVGTLADNFAAVAEQDGIIEGMTSTISKAMGDAGDWLSSGGGEKIGKAVGAIVASGIELAVKAIPTLVVDVIPAIGKGIIMGGAEAANSLIRDMQDWLGGEFGADRTIILEMELALAANGRMYTDEVVTEIARGTGYISEQSALAIRAGLAAGQDIATKEFGDWISSTFGLFGLNTLTKAADEMGYAYAVTLAEGIGKGELSIAQAMEKLQADLSTQEAAETAAKQYQSILESQAAGIQQHEEQVKPILDRLTAAYEQILNPTKAWNTVIETEGKHFDNSKQSMKEYAKELEKQLEASKTYAARVEEMARVYGQDYSAEALTVAAEQGGVWMQKFWETDEATRSRVLASLQEATQLNMTTAAEIIVEETNKIPGEVSSIMNFSLYGDGWDTGKTWVSGFVSSVDGTKVNVSVSSSGKMSAGASSGGASKVLPIPTTWFDGGGLLEPGTGMTTNKTGKPEPVFTDAQWNQIKEIKNSGEASGAVVAKLDEVLQAIESLPRDYQVAGKVGAGGRRR